MIEGGHSNSDGPGSLKMVDWGIIGNQTDGVAKMMDGPKHSNPDATGFLKMIDGQNIVNQTNGFAKNDGWAKRSKIE